MTTAARVCPRDGVNTALACSNCGTPVCPQCLVRTSVGFRCQSCATTTTATPRAAPFGWIAGAGVVALFALVLVLVVHPWASTSASEAPGGTTVPASKGPSGNTAPAGYELEVRVSGGYSLDVPASWSAAGDDTPAQLSFAATPATAGAVHVYLHQTPLDLNTWLTGFASGLPSVGGVGIHTLETQVAGLPGMLLAYQQPASQNPGAPMVTFSTYLVKKGGTIFNLQLSSLQNSAPAAAFLEIVSSFKLL